MPNDPKFDDLYGLNNLGLNSAVFDADIDPQKLGTLQLVLKML